MLKVIDPSRGTPLHEYSTESSLSVERALKSAEDTFAEWRETSFAERSSLLKKVARHMRDNVEALALPMTEEMGKPIKEARGEVLKSAWCAEHYAEHAESYLSVEVIPSDAARSYVQYLPLGPLLGILPWNAPFWLAFRFCAPALMAGNTCIIKHDSHVPACSSAIAGVFHDVDAPSGLFQNLLMTSSRIESVIRDPRIQAVSFTGSSKAGSAVAAVAASEVKPAVLELGGSDPSVVLADADLEKAAEVITLSRIINTGQSCIAVKRIIVEAPVHDRLVSLLKERLAALKVGDPRLESTDIGPIAREDLRHDLHRQVQETIAAGAKCLLGGELPEGRGFFYPATLLTDVTPGMTAFREETFGPVAVVIRAENEQHAMELANDTPYGLAAGIWTHPSRGEALARKFQAGQVAVNGIVKTDPRLPSGGIKKSGYGRELGPHGIREFVNAQQVWIGPANPA
ncbi:MAG: NAD-dependent succinate-semialdehyde dehydrogenase [Desulfobacterales bacterium]